MEGVLLAMSGRPLAGERLRSQFGTLMTALLAMVLAGVPVPAFACGNCWNVWTPFPLALVMVVGVGVLGLLALLDWPRIWAPIAVTGFLVLMGAIIFPPLPVGVLIGMLFCFLLTLAQIPKNPSPAARKAGYLAIAALGLGVALPLALAGLTPVVMRNRQSHLSECKTRLQNLGKALERYSVDHQGRFPVTLGELVPKYMGGLPRCMAAAGEDSLRTIEFYTARFDLNFGDYSYVANSRPDAYTLTCQGKNHPRLAYCFVVPPGEDCFHPTCTSNAGLAPDR